MVASSSIPSSSSSLPSFPALPSSPTSTGDGTPDLASVYASGGDIGSDNQSRLAFSKGNANASFTRAGASVSLGVRSANGAVAGDLDNDGRQDIAVAFNDTSSSSSGLILLTGKGDGTFSTPVSVASATTSIQSTPLAADLDGDGKPDLVWGANAYLNRGGNTFTPLALPVQGKPLLLADLDGDHLLDIVIDNAVYTGKGDGTFLPTPLALISTPASANFVSASAGDVNGDGNTDLAILTFSDMSVLTVAYGDGAGHFTTDSNSYTYGTHAPVSGAFARINNNAPSLPGDNRLDYLLFADGAAISLFNQTNPRPAPPSPIATTLKINLQTGTAPLQPTNLFAQVTGYAPTGTITFTAADGTVLASGAIRQTEQYSINAPYSFPSAGAYTITAIYSGDAINAPSSATSTVTLAKGPSSLVLLSGAGTVYAGRDTPLSVQVKGYNPTAPVTFTLGSTVIGTAPITTGGHQAGLHYTFPDVGTYSLTVSYPGDASNLPSISSVYAINVVPAPDFALSATSTTITVNAGDKATWNVHVTSLNGYGGRVRLACQLDNCSYYDVNVTPTQSGEATFSLQTKAPSSGAQPNLRNMRITPIFASAFVLLGLRRRWKAPGLRLPLIAMVLGVTLGLSSITGCSSSKDSSSTTQASNPGTTYNIVLTGTDSSIPTTHQLTLTLVIK